MELFESLVDGVSTWRVIVNAVQVDLVVKREVAAFRFRDVAVWRWQLMDRGRFRYATATDSAEQWTTRIVKRVIVAAGAHSSPSVPMSTSRMFAAESSITAS